MSMVLNEEQRLLQDTVKEFLKDNAPIEAMRALRDSKDELGYSKELWQQLVELGIPAMALPEAYGGLGFGYMGLGAALEEMGRTLTATPLYASVVLGASAIELGGSEVQKQELLPRVASGDLTLALAIDESLHHQPLDTTLTLIEVNGQLVLNGNKCFVLDGHSADQLIVVARSSGHPGESDGLSLALVERDQPGVKVRRTHLMDGRNAANIEFDRVCITPESLLGNLNEGWEVLNPVLQRGAICIAAEMLGGALESFQRTLDFISEREQFDVKIGSFQALQHRCAQMFCQLEQCKTAVLNGLSSIDKQRPDIGVQASLAKTLVNDAYQHVTNEAVQMHGGMGITDELDLGLFLKRARVSIQILGDSRYHSDQYASQLGF